MQPAYEYVIFQFESRTCWRCRLQCNFRLNTVDVLWDELYNSSHKLSLKENMMKRIIEIKGAEGGTDSRLFAKDLAAAYIKFANRVG
jgi:hypothetical protein